VISRRVTDGASVGFPDDGDGVFGVQELAEAGSAV